MSEKLPQGWEVAELGALGRWRGGGTPSKSVPAYWSNGTVHWVSPKDMKRLMIDSAEDQITLAAVKESAANLIPKDSVLMVTRSGILEHTFPVAINTVEVAVNQDLKAWTPHPGINPLYAAYFLKAEGRTILDNCAKDGTTVASIDFDRLKAYPVRLAPEPEQARIVSKIDELFSSIDEGERALERVRKLVERYRQSVLKAAVTGELTRDWREQHAGELESGEALLTRILDARRKAWETAELAKMTAKNQRPLNDTWKKKYVAPPPPDIADLPELPPSWTWASLGSLIVVGPQNGVYIPQAKYGSGTPIIRIDDFQTDWIRPVGELRRVQATDQDCLTYGVKRADLIINRVNSVSHLGKCMLVPEGFDGALFESNMMRCSVSDLLVKEVLVAYLNSEFGRRRATKNCKHAVNQASINQDDVAEIPIPLPPLAEQQALVDAIHLEMSKLPADIDDVSKLAAALRQSLLRDAFAGLIVPQDPTDEPASTLLERIAAQRSDRDSPRKRVPKPLRRKNVKA